MDHDKQRLELEMNYLERKRAEIEEQIESLKRHREKDLEEVSETGDSSGYSPSDSGSDSSPETPAKSK